MSLEERRGTENLHIEINMGVSRSTRIFSRAMILGALGRPGETRILRSDIPFSSPGFERYAEGSMAFANERGTIKWRNEDALVVSPPAQGFAVIDGMGGTNDGRMAAAIVAEEIAEGLFTHPRPISEVHANAHRRIVEDTTRSFKSRNDVTDRTLRASEPLKEELLTDLENGASYAAVRIHDGEAFAYASGDVRVLILEDGRLRWFHHDQRGGRPATPRDATKARFVEGPASALSGSLDPQKYGPMHFRKALRPKSRIVVASDGLLDNLVDDREILPDCLDYAVFKRERTRLQGFALADAVRGLDPVAAVKALGRFLDLRVPDNMSVVVADWDGPAPVA